MLYGGEIFKNEEYRKNDAGKWFGKKSELIG
jgi:hypothetical protein